MAGVRIKRAYESPDPEDGYRVLVERLWPRGVRKEALKLDAWSKDVAPSDELRRWFGHEPARWTEFARRYRTELREAAAARVVSELITRAADATLTLIYAARDEQHNGALVLQAVLRRSIARRAKTKPRAKASSRTRR